MKSVLVLDQRYICAGATADGFWLDDHRRVMVRMDGKFIVYDGRLPPARRTLHGATFPSAAAAIAYSRRSEAA